MMPLSIAPLSTEVKVMKLLTDEKLKQHLNNLGIIVGSNITLIQEKKGDVILNVKGVRVALNKKIKKKIYVTV